MRFWFFKDPVDGMWKGILLPGDDRLLFVGIAFP